ncbi:MAG: DUF1989 domain-containing protein [Acidiferrobacterales bacterium]|nr:DUF1989 domain-containing protein [Acidiferrobacterales bacterium]
MLPELLEPGITRQALEPGLNPFNLGRERYVVRGGAMTLMPLLPGDQIEIVDPEGLQCAHIAAFDSHGTDCSGQFSKGKTVEGQTLAEMLNAETPGAHAIRSKLKRFDMNLATAQPKLLLDGETAPGSRISLNSNTECIGIIGAPGNPMPVDQQNPPTDLIVWVTRNSPAQHISYDLPDPLAAPTQDFRIEASTAVTYEVKAGDYIQVLDIDGRQCSDFQCFDIPALDKGLERCLDATVTRSLMGAAYPSPGLFSKFFDVDLQPVIEVVQDTCGRHDSFGLACTSKTYDEMGYPGHPNCSDNFNFALEEYPVAPRKGWMAINLFFNSFFDDNFQLLSDEPWSRPGDYVLMRAMRDMVCVSSSCSDDIDPANAWNPTDIQVRVYDRKELFKSSIAIRMTTDADPIMTQETGFHSETSKLTRNYVENAGYWMPSCYLNQGAIEEYWACRRGVVVTDLSALRKYEVLGPDAELLLQTCLTRDMKKLSVGQVSYTAMCNESGGMIDDGTVFRLAPHNFRWVGGCDGSGLWLREQAEKLGLKVWVKNSTDQLANLQVQGPNSRKLLSQLIWTRPDQASVEELGWFRFSVARMQDAAGLPIVVSRTGYTGELGYEIFCHPRDAATVWQMIIDPSHGMPVTPMGMDALDMLRIEAGLILAGHEFCEQTDPFEAGIPFTVPLKSKTDNFIGREALERRKANPQRKLVGLELVGREAAESGDGVFNGRYRVGDITSSTVSPVLGKTIALCKMNIEFSEDGTEVQVGKLDDHQKRIPAAVVPFPHFDPTKSRVRGIYPESD